MWEVTDIGFELADELTDDPVATIIVTTPAGQIRVIAEFIDRGTTLLLRGTHIQDAEAKAIGHANLRIIAQAAMEGMDYDGLEVEGAVRTTGANPGRRPGVFRFTRRLRPDIGRRTGIGPDD